MKVEEMFLISLGLEVARRVFRMKWQHFDL